MSLLRAFCADASITDVRPLTMKTSTLAIVINAVKSSPKWIPAQHDGKKVTTIKIQPINAAKSKMC